MTGLLPPDFLAPAAASPRWASPHALTLLQCVPAREKSTRIFSVPRAATRATRGDPCRGVAGWSDAQMRAYVGSGLASKMPAYYSHLVHRDMQDRVRADAQADPLAARIREHPLGMPSALAGIVARRRLATLKGVALSVWTTFRDEPSCHSGECQECSFADDVPQPAERTAP